MKRLFAVTLCTLLLGACSSPADEPDPITVCSGLACADVGPEPDVASVVDMSSTTSPDVGVAPDTGSDTGSTLPTLAAAGAGEADVLYGWVVAGQPSEARVEEIVATGATIISLRLQSEDPFDEPALIDSLGGTFIRYPTSAPDYDGVPFREAMYDMYDAELDAGNIVYLHCASANRAGASWALYQAERKGVDPEEAIAMGKAAGLASLETLVRQILGV